MTDTQDHFPRLTITPRASDQTTQDTYDLAYELIKPEPLTPTANILFLGGFQSSMLGKKASQLAEWAPHQGWRYARMDYRGHGLSDWDFADCTLADWLDDAAQILLHCFEENQPVIVIGSSMGSWLAYHLAIRYPKRVCAIIAIGTAPDFIGRRIYTDLSADQKHALVTEGKALLPFHDKPMKQAFFTEADKLNLLDQDSLPINCPLHMLHGLLDDIAPWQNTTAISDRVETKEVVIELIKTGDHSLSTPYDLQRLFFAIEQLKRRIR